MVTTSLWLAPKIAPFPHIYMHVYICTNVYVYMCASTYICPLVCMCVHVCKCGYVCIHMWAYLCVHICVYVCLCTSLVCVHMFVCVQPLVLFTLSFEIDSIIGLELNQWVPRMHDSLPPSTGITRAHHHARLFFMAYGSLNSGPHVYVGAFSWLNCLFNFLLSL